VADDAGAAAVEAQRGLQLPVLQHRPEMIAIPQAARVMAAGHGGQILLSGSTAGIIAGIDLVGRASPARPVKQRASDSGPGARTEDRFACFAHAGRLAREPVGAGHLTATGTGHRGLSLRGDVALKAGEPCFVALGVAVA
jgi:hypothetical protein